MSWNTGLMSEAAIVAELFAVLYLGYFALEYFVLMPLPIGRGLIRKGRKWSQFAD